MVERLGGSVLEGFIGLLLVFVISALTDTFAYLVGMTYGKIRKGNVKKLCPKLSPNKTVAGAIGGLIGGAIGSVAIYFIFGGALNLELGWLIFIAIGIVMAIATEVGDLLESLIKRRAGIKDMGKIMPGHGGVLDRIDGILLASLVACLAFLII